MAVASLIVAIIIIVLLLSIAVRLRLLPVSKSSTAKPEAYYDLSETDKYPHKLGFDCLKEVVFNMRCWNIMSLVSFYRIFLAN